MEKKIQVRCFNCNVIFDKTASNVKRSKNHYCSRSCSAKKNNKHFPKRTKEIKFCDCGNQKSRGKYCCECWEKKKNIGQSPDIKLKDMLTNDTQRFARIRGFARTVFFRNKPKICEICGYNKHVEVAHKKALSSFDHDALLSEVNSLENLIGLCPNCHWEFDNKMIDG
jgi:hypothetical protein